MLLYKNAFRDLLYFGGYMKNILIIEDDRMLNKGVALALKKEGYNTMCAYTKEEGKKLIQQNEVDLIYVMR